MVWGPHRWYLPEPTNRILVVSEPNLARVERFSRGGGGGAIHSHRETLPGELHKGSQDTGVVDGKEGTALVGRDPAYVVL